MKVEGRFRKWKSPLRRPVTTQAPSVPHIFSKLLCGKMECRLSTSTRRAVLKGQMPALISSVISFLSPCLPSTWVGKLGVKDKSRYLFLNLLLKSTEINWRVHWKHRIQGNQDRSALVTLSNFSPRYHPLHLPSLQVLDPTYLLVFCLLSITLGFLAIPHCEFSFPCRQSQSWMYQCIHLAVCFSVKSSCFYFTLFCLFVWKEWTLILVPRSSQASNMHLRVKRKRKTGTIKRATIWMEYRRKSPWTKMMEKEHDRVLDNVVKKATSHYWIPQYFILSSMCISNVINHDLYSTFSYQKKPVVSSTHINMCPLGIKTSHLSVKFPRPSSVKLGHLSLLFCNEITLYLRVVRRRNLPSTRGAWHRILDFYSFVIRRWSLNSCIKKCWSYRNLEKTPGISKIQGVRR